MEEGANSSNINKAYKFYRGCVRGLAGVFNNLSKIFVVSEVVLHKCFHYKREGWVLFSSYERRFLPN